MAEAVLDIKQWANSPGIRLPASVARKAHLRDDQRVRISMEDGQVILTPVIDTPSPCNNAWHALTRPHGREVMAGRPHRKAVVLTEIAMKRLTDFNGAFMNRCNLATTDAEGYLPMSSGWTSRTVWAYEVHVAG